MKHRLILLAAFIFNCYTLFAQNVRFTSSGIIEFEKTINKHAAFKKALEGSDGMLDNLFDSYKKSTPQFKVVKSTLKFSAGKTLFTPVAAETDGSMMSFDGMGPDQPNIVYTNLDAHTFTTEKIVFDETFLLKDNTRKINWKLTSEMRTIAGYECRRANAIIMDSVYVVAFYTDKIPVSGGPESFTGLPGMILGIAMPHDNVTWFAKTVTDRPIPESEIKPPVKGKPTDHKGLLETINKLLGKWGGNGNRLIKPLLL
uniref:GLPGLI family protein n=1 Tax=Pedobacter schmidteae TaxID=2201271 RepID=UPI000EAC14D6|nr:GLPGLI family protein [Pedobacter schmidteae]